MEIMTTKEVSAKLTSYSVEVRPRYGMCSKGVYEVDGLPFKYTVYFRSKFPPRGIDADIVAVRLSGDAPMIYVDHRGYPMLDKDFNVLCTRVINVMCPVKERKDGVTIYWPHHNPLEVAERFVHRHLKPCKFGRAFTDLVQ